MEIKSLILGLFMSTAAFALKSGGGLTYVFLKNPGTLRRLCISLCFMAGYGLVFGASALLLLSVDLMAHVDLLQDFFKSGMTLHFLIAATLIIWGILLLKQDTESRKTTKGWLALVVPCPVCFSVILLSCSFVNALYPGQPLVFVFLYAGFTVISLLTAYLGAHLVKAKGNAEHLLGTLMVSISVYFLISVIVVPQFADLNKIYRISSTGPGSEFTDGNIILIIVCICAVAAGFFNPFRRNI